MIDKKNNSFSTKRITNSPTFSIEEMLDQAQNNTQQESSPSRTMTL
jgi:hypothetical protein